MNKYTADGKNDTSGNHVPDTSLKYLMEQLSDIQDEAILLQYYGLEKTWGQGRQVSQMTPSNKNA
jgi:hypothetical protein